MFGNTFFYDNSIESIISNNDNFEFPIKKDGYRLMSNNAKSANVAIHWDKFNDLISNADLKMTNHISGYWKDHEMKNSYNDFQDIIVIKK